MKRPLAILGSTIFLIAPGFVAGVFPYWISRWRFSHHSLPLEATGVVVLAAGLVLLLDCFARFALQGRGTPSPALPTERLVVTGMYRYVRNPMYLAVLALILGQALFFGSVDLLTYAAFIWLAFTLFVLLYEEPTLRRTYDEEYDDYCAHVGRWIPRLTPWQPR